MEQQAYWPGGDLLSEKLRLVPFPKMLFLANTNKSSTSAPASSSTSGSWFSSSGDKGKGDAVDQVKKWKRELEKQARHMDRDIQNMQRAEQRSINECKALAKKGRTGAVRILAKEIANTRRTIARMYSAKAQLNSVASTLQTSISMMKLQGCMVKSAEVMTAMNKLVNINEISATMNNMAREMEKVGLVDEVIGDAFDSMEVSALQMLASSRI